MASSGDLAGERLAVERALANELLQGERLEQVAPAFLRSAIQLLRWDAGAIWEVTSPDEPLRFVGAWEDPEGRFEELWAASRELPVTRGVDLP